MGMDTWRNAAGLNKQVLISYLENRTVEEKSKQLNEVKQDIAIFFLHPYDVGQGKGPISVDASICRGGPWEEPELEKVLHHNVQLRKAEKRGQHHELVKWKQQTKIYMFLYRQHDTSGEILDFVIFLPGISTNVSMKTDRV